LNPKYYEDGGRIGGRVILRPPGFFLFPGLRESVGLPGFLPSPGAPPLGFRESVGFPPPGLGAGDGVGATGAGAGGSGGAGGTSAASSTGS